MPQSKKKNKIGKTKKLIQSLPETDKYLFIVCGSDSDAMEVRFKVIDYWGEEIKHIRCISLLSMYLLKGIDPIDIFFDHTSYEKANAKQLSEIFYIEEMREQAWMGVK